MKPKFQIGDMIQSGSAPQIVYLIRGFESSTYTLSSPDKNDNWIVKAQSEVDQYFRKNAREFNRQEKELNSVPPEPGFDEDGSPTYEEDH